MSELHVGAYQLSSDMKRIANHAAVMRADTQGLIAITGPAGDPTSEYYARLFAAAPKLLEMLTDIVDATRECEACDGSGLEPRTDEDACHNCGGTGEYAVVVTVADLRAVIAKATER